jgi:hypothetical protein
MHRFDAKIWLANAFLETKNKFDQSGIWTHANLAWLMLFLKQKNKFDTSGIWTHANLAC